MLALVRVILSWMAGVQCFEYIQLCTYPSRILWRSFTKDEMCVVA